MVEKIQALTDDQAQHALLGFYELLPPDLWQGEKPTPADLEFWEEEIFAAATPDIKSFLTAVKEPGDTSIRAETARIILTQLSGHEIFRPYVRQAVDAALVPHMAPLPLIISAVTLVVLAAMPRKIVKQDAEGNSLTMELGQLESAADFIKAITGFLKEAKSLGR